jgi:AraC-like DNA-binding protein
MRSELKKPAITPESARLSALIRAYAPHDGTFGLRIPGLFATRRSKPYKDIARDLVLPALCIVAQGSKAALLGKEVFEYDASRMIVFAVNMPLGFQITRASAAEPYLGIRIDLDPHQIADLVLKVYPKGLLKAAGDRAVMLAQADVDIQRAAIRLMALMAKPQDAEVLAPLAIEEILIRLLRGPMGPRVAQMGFAKSGVPGVAKAVSWLCENFSQPMRVEELSGLANMSPSSFHQHFKKVTSMSPLQYQKVLRLQEARRLMLSEMLDAGRAGQQVGYISASQFSREYGRLFGKPPSKDIEVLREGMA